MPTSQNKYCPFCQRDIEPYVGEDTGEVFEATDGGKIYVHDDVPHDDDYTFEALQ